MFDAIVFAGGGNRCYWQQGVYEVLGPALELRPRRVVGASAGAFQAAVSLLGLGAEVRPLVIGACAPDRNNVDWKALLRAGTPSPWASPTASSCWRSSPPSVSSGSRACARS